MGRSRISRGELHYFSDSLKQKLKDILHALVTVVEAPSGYGKTTAIRDFLKAELSQGTPVYWFTAVDEAPAAGFRRLCHEIDKIDSQAGERLLKIEFPNAVTAGEACDAIRSIQCRHEAYLVIDNFQLLHTFLPPSFFTALLEHGGEGLHIIIVTQLLKRNMLTAIAGRGFLHITASDLKLDAEDIRRYYALAGLRITHEDALAVEHYTEGWIIAVYLQLCAYLDTGVLYGMSGILALMEHLVWDTLTEEQQVFLLRLSPFEMITVQQACALNGFDKLPEYALDALESPFIRHEAYEGRYELHSILSQLLIQKSSERGSAFERKCFLSAGDLCRDEGKISSALGFYWKAEDFERMLSMDFSNNILENIGDSHFAELALDIAANCPIDIKRNNMLSMLRVAWALYMNGKKAQYELLLEELRELPELSGDSDLMGEWLLLASYRSYPKIAEMTAALRQAAVLFKGRCSRVILPSAPWCLGHYCTLAELHTVPGEVDREAEELEEYIGLYSQLTGGHGSGADVLFRAELAYHRGNLSEAEILAYKAAFLAESRQQSIVLLGSTIQLAEIALHKADTAGWQNAISSMERAASFTSQDSFILRQALDIARGVLFNELHQLERIADWLKKGDFSDKRLTPLMISNAGFVHISYLMHRGEFPRMLGMLEATYPERLGPNPFRDMILYLTLAVGYLSVGNRDQACALVARAGEMALPDGLIFPFAAYSWLLQGLSDELVRKKYPELTDKFNEIKDRFSSGWTRLHEDITPEEFPPDLTPREYEVAKLAAEGLHNSEIAKRLVVTESTVRTHMRAIFQKLDIDRRTKLAEKLK
ncbi:MAG TPA: LuxR C-terminal-related transcriptional regulator [Bacillota bacterium]|nr:LuxR C-terminal-related transcriptional regulator [Bacillota bacterium]HPX67954.1 LuxR C-terminal-related transcriptional regulator [Bacillota bacterium]HQA64921.1 LuxR C-terminal-related transcriptional regulator [Bacillota bacterium]HQO42453.1 LuxR C-terminal-related transcriptional regulator [Bacillota bacterium]HQQ44590.1 LuxR C-terminal-related transcriptional regulator [Bacillota bacterium]